MTSKPVVIDTNVLHVANDNSKQAGPTCVLNAVKRLERVRLSGRPVLDRSGFILREYIDQRFQFAGQPGYGDAFFKWLFDNQANDTVCELVSITPHDDEGTEFTEFPADPHLRGFDRKDRKFVAVALASPGSPPVLNAVDSDWWDFRDALQRHGLQIEFVCPELFR